MEDITLEQEVELHQKKIHADSYPQSIGEICSMYQNKELIINPEFQRFFRWDKEKKSRLIESILLSLPLPSFFVSTNEKHEWELVDGLQRISTILEFMGELRPEHSNNINEENSIGDGLIESDNFRYLKKLGSKKWDNLSDELKRSFKRYKLNFNILKVSTDKKVKYELFERLNTGGAQLSNQEVRNCIMIMENRGFYIFIEDLSKDENFQNTIDSLSEKDSSSQYDKELILRFFALRYYISGDKITSVSKFIEDKMYNFLVEFDYKKETEIFYSTFYVLNKTLGNDIFKRYYKDEKKFKRKIIIPFYDILTLFVSNNLNVDVDSLRKAIINIWEEIPETSIIQKSIGVGPRIESKLIFALTEGQKILSSKVK
ncbi:MAG: DUF262 domain-containing protein [Candidatus Gracilibacteria bacterium]|nr:DUF262 domain-containing protein [Candidatus Gracilibacteria bacterium]